MPNRTDDITLLETIFIACTTERTGCRFRKLEIRIANRPIANRNRQKPMLYQPRRLAIRRLAILDPSESPGSKARPERTEGRTLSYLEP